MISVYLLCLAIAGIVFALLGRYPARVRWLIAGAVFFVLAGASTAFVVIIGDEMPPGARPVTREEVGQGRGGGPGHETAP
jgi:MFS family permease